MGKKCAGQAVSGRRALLFKSLQIEIHHLGRRGVAEPMSGVELSVNQTGYSKEEIRVLSSWGKGCVQEPIFWSRKRTSLI